MVDISSLLPWITGIRATLDTVKTARDLLPPGDKKEEIGKKIEEAEDALKRSDAELAKALGYRLCQCTFPPQIMLWNESERMFVCPNPDCGHKEARGTNISPAAIKTMSIRRT